MRQGIVGLIILIIGVAIFALIFIFTQTKIIERGEDAKIQTQQIQNKVIDLQNNLQWQQNRELEVNP